MAATITGVFKKPDSTLLTSTLIQFIPKSTPYIYASSIITSQAQSATTDGSGSLGAGIVLLPGTYLVIVGSIDSFLISVPDDSSTHTIQSLLQPTLADPSLLTPNTSSDPAKLELLLPSTSAITINRKGDANEPFSVHCFIGNYGGSVNSRNAEETSLATTVHSILNGASPFALHTLGNNNYPDGDALDIDQNVGLFWQDYMLGYSGGYGSGSLAGQHFYPSIGQVDAGNVVGGGYSYAGYTGFMPAPAASRYYTVVIGEVRFFVLNSDKNEPDGFSNSSTQALWFYAQIAASTSRWNVVYLCNPPYCSATGFANNWMNTWDFAGHGAHAVIGGDAPIYERLTKNGIPHFVCGTGGAVNVGTAGSPIAGSELIDTSGYGFLLMFANSTQLVFNYVNFNGGLIDTKVVSGASSLSKVYTSLKISPYSGLVNTSSGASLRWGLGPKQVPSYHDIQQQTATQGWGQLIASDTAPDTTDPRVFNGGGWINTSVNPTQTKYWNQHSEAWEYGQGGSTLSTKSKTAVPVMTPPGAVVANIDDFVYGIVFTQGEANTTIYYSIDGGVIASGASGTRRLLSEGPHYIMFYGKATGKRPSIVQYVTIGYAGPD